VSAVQGVLKSGRHIGVVVEVEVVLVEVEVVLVEVVVVGVVVVVVVVLAWQLPLEQLPLQHCVSLVQFFPLRLHPGGSADASPMPTDPSAPPTRAAPINLRALPRVREPSASPLARSSKKPSSLAIGCPLLEMTGPVGPAQSINVVKYEGLHSLTQLRRIILMRTSENNPSTHFAE
jgi:hypothetical protein